MCRMHIPRRDQDSLRALADRQLRDWIAGQNPVSGFRRAAQREMERRTKRGLALLWGVSAALAAGFLIWFYL